MICDASKHSYYANGYITVYRKGHIITSTILQILFRLIVEDNVRITAKSKIKRVSPQHPIENIYQESLETFNVGLKKVRELPPAEMVKTQRRVNKAFEKSLKMIAMFDDMCKENGIRLHPLKQSCLELTFEMNTSEALNCLWHWYQSGELLKILHKVLITDFLLKKFEVKAIELDVYMAFEDYQQCLKRIGGYIVSILVIKGQVQHFLLKNIITVRKYCLQVYK